MKVIRALLFWFGMALGVIALSGVYVALTLDAPMTAPIWRQS
ncbi:hypothetical protein N234_31775 [Ralstonia pickettii DTP0602]|nr:hypothetical protein N234_31775 [Ralstonia pickettii DTP0602]